MSKIKDFGNKKEKFHYHNYLTCLVKALENHHTIIDLRNESSVSGLITSVDGLMNVEMKHVTFYDPQGKVHQFDNFFVNARNIRYVHIPEGLNINELITKQVEELHFKPRPPKVMTLKNKRAKKYQQEILEQLNSPKAGPSHEQQ